MSLYDINIYTVDKESDMKQIFKEMQLYFFFINFKSSGLYFLNSQGDQSSESRKQELL